MDNTLTQILRALVEAHSWRDRAEQEITHLRKRIADLEALPTSAAAPVNAIDSSDVLEGWP